MKNKFALFTGIFVVVAVAAAALVILVLGGDSNDDGDDSSSSEVIMVGVNEEIETPEASYVVTAVDEIGAALEPTTSVTEPEECESVNGRYVLLTITATNNLSEEIDSSDLKKTVFYEGEGIFDNEFPAFVCDNPTINTDEPDTVAAGESLEYNLLLDIAPDATDYKLDVSPSLSLSEILDSSAEDLADEIDDNEYYIDLSAEL
jgi:hypothetical protein